jgi:hypothetical protein
MLMWNEKLSQPVSSVECPPKLGLKIEAFFEANQIRRHPPTDDCYRSQVEAHFYIFHQSHHPRTKTKECVYLIRRHDASAFHKLINEKVTEKRKD